MSGPDDGTTGSGTYDGAMTGWVLDAEVKDLFERLYRGAIEGKRDRASALRRVGEIATPAAIP